MKFPQHKGPYVGVAAFSFYALLALGGFVISRVIHGKDEIEKPQAEGSLFFVGLLLGTIFIAASAISILGNTNKKDLQTQQWLEHDPKKFDPSPSFGEFFFNNKPGKLSGPVTFTVASSVVALGTLVFQLTTSDIVVASMFTGAMGLLGLITAVLIHLRFDALCKNPEDQSLLPTPEM